jgi:hypothetical protein
MLSKHRLDPLEQAVVQTLAYADVFNYPLSLQEIERYLIGMSASQEDISKTIVYNLLDVGLIQQKDEYYSLADREIRCAVRSQRSRIADRLWPQAIRFGRWIARVPFIRMVAVTGALAVNNVTAGADIDYLLVTEPGRLWISRAQVILIVRWAALFGIKLCPNFIISKNALVFEDQNLYTAHELAQMVPLSGYDIYSQLRQENDWVDAYLPNARGCPAHKLAQKKSQSIAPDGTYLIQKLLESVLRFPWANKLEDWEMRRKIRKFKIQWQDTSALQPAEVSFCADWCKGHFDRHGENTLAAFSDRLERLQHGYLPGVQSFPVINNPSLQPR